MKTAIIDVGGGMRGVYAAGVLEYCLDNDINFDIAFGISAGGGNLVCFLGKQKMRNYTFYTEYAFRPQYMSIKNLIFKKSYIDLDYVYTTLGKSDGENPFDYDTFVNNPTELFIVATEALTGKPKYFTKSDFSLDKYDVLKASSCIPFICKPQFINGVPYYDGALSDSIPIEKAFELGCDKVVLILTKPQDTVRIPNTDIKLAKLIKNRYPIAAQALCNRADHYNKYIVKAKKYASEGKLLIVAPDDTCGVSTLSRNKNNFIRLYNKGYSDGIKISSFIK